MREWTPRIIILTLFAVILGLPFFFKPESTAAKPGAVKLVVITPHNEQIRYEIERGFSDWHQKKYGTPVTIDWRAIGGTSDIERQLMSEYAGLLEHHDMDAGAGYDVVFGGGDYFFDKVLKVGVKAKDGTHTILEPIDLGADFVKQVYPTPTIADVKLYDPDHMWWGVVLSSFGIAYNNDRLALAHQPTPTTWSDLNDPAYYMGVALADPSHSGSIRVTYEAILQRYGWDRGWRTLRRVCANARYFAADSAEVPVDVSQGEAMAGMCIDFYGRYQAEVVGRGRMGYVAPADATVVTPDPVAVLRGAEHRELAIQFVHFLLSTPGQELWAYRAGEPGGPEKFELRRPPVRRDMYTPAKMAQMVDAVDPYQLAKPLPPHTPHYFLILPAALHAMAMDIHGELKEAWMAVCREKDPQVRAKMLKHFDALPFTAEELAAAPAKWKADPDAQTRDRLAWTAFFRDQYQQVLDLAGR